MPSNTVRPFATTLMGRRKSRIDGESRSVNALTPSVDASTTFALRTESTRPEGFRRGKIGCGAGSTSTGSKPPRVPCERRCARPGTAPAIARVPFLHLHRDIPSGLHSFPIDAFDEAIASPQAELKGIRARHNLMRSAAIDSEPQAEIES